MPITWIKGGDIFESACQTIAIPVNMVPGVMGKGLALAARQRWPMVVGYHGYAARQGYFEGWHSVLWDNDPGNSQVLLIPTKRHWRDKSRIVDIVAALEFVGTGLRQGTSTVTSIAFPALGCGLGGLDWADVRPLMARYLGELDIPVEVYEPRESG